jgi:hypothetical protein
MKLTIQSWPIWGETLRGVLPSYQWEKLRAPYNQRAAGSCDICGAKSDKLNGHTVFETDRVNHIRRATSIEMLCHSCLDVRHMGRFGQYFDPHEPETMDLAEHFMQVNECDLAGC